MSIEGDAGSDGFKMIVRAVWRNRALALISTLALFLGLSAFVLSLKPQYVSEALLLVAPGSGTEAAELRAAQGSSGPTDPFLLRSEGDVLSSEELCRRVISNLNLSATADFSGTTDIVKAYRARLGVFNDGRSLSFRVSFTAEDANLAAKIANAHVDAYLSGQAERRASKQKAALRWLQLELERLQSGIRANEAELQAFREQAGPLTRQRGADPDPLDSNIEQLRLQLGGANRDLHASQERLAEAERSSGGDAQTNIGEARSSVELAATRVKVIESEIGRLQLQKHGAERLSAELRTREAEVLAKRSVFETVLNRYNTVLAQQGSESADARLISAASVPSKPAFPRTNLFLLVSALASIGVGVGIAFVREKFRDRNPSIEVVAGPVQLRPLGSIPFPEQMTERYGRRVAAAIFWERIRSIRSMLPLSAGGSVLLITSSLPKEGKSLVAASLAKSFAATGARTLLLDADLRCPTAARAMAQASCTAGLAEVLTNRVSMEEALLNIGEHLSLLPAVPNRAAQSDLLASQEMKALVSQARSKFDVTIIDSAPIGLVSDALMLAGLADLCVIVARSSLARTEVLADTVARLRAAGGDMAGLVMTGAGQADAELLDGTEYLKYMSGQEEAVPYQTGKSVPSQADVRAVWSDK